MLGLARNIQIGSLIKSQILLSFYGRREKIKIKLFSIGKSKKVNKDN